MVEHKLYITGDCHGEEARMIYAGFAYNIDLEEGDILFCCGDWGYIFDGSDREEKFLDYLAEDKPYTICWIDGNHENFTLINQYPVEIWNGGKVHVIRRDKKGNPKVIHLMRGQVFNIYEKKFFTFGGAYSADKKLRTPGFDWWEQEMPTDEEMEEGNRNLEMNNYEVDYILTHAAPEDTMNMFCPFHDNERRLNNYLEYIRERTKYKYWYIGHLHRDKDIWRHQSILWFDVRNILTGEVVPEEQINI